MGKRVFTAIKVEDEAVTEELCRIRDRLNIGFKPVKKSKMHITLEFFKNLEEEKLKGLENHLKTINKQKFELRIKNIGCFPSKDYIRVVWAGAENPEIFELYEKISDHSINPDNTHPFQPHITLFRVSDISKTQKKKLQKQIEEYKEHKFGKITVNNFKLYESITHKNGTTYKELETYKLE